MVTCESTKSYKIPLKSCHNSVIDHNHVTISLSVEWPEKGGDDPKLVIDITDKRPSISYPQQSRSSSSLVINSTHHHYQQQQQENFQSTYQQQYYHQHHLSTPNNHDLLRSKPTTSITSGDHNDVSSTTATVLYDVIQPQPLSQSQISTSCATIQQIKNHLKSQLSPIFRRQSIPNQEYLSPQHVIQTPSNMNDTRLNTQMPTISPPSSIKQIPSVTTHIHDLQQAPPIMTYPSSTGTNSQLKSLLCRCSNPINQHEHHCPAFTSAKLQSNTNLTSESMYPPPNDRAIAHRTLFPSRAYPNDTMTISGMKEPILTAALLPLPNSNLTKTPVGSSANVTTIVSQHSPFLNNNPMGPTGNTSSFNIDNNFQRDTFMFPQDISNQSNYQTSPSIPIVRKQNGTSTVPRSRKTRPVKHNSLTNQDQTPNNSQQSSHNINSPSLLTSPIQLPHGLFRLQDSSQTTTNLSPTNTLHASTNDITGCNTQQQRPPSPMIRSPVKLDFPVPQNSTPSSVSLDDIDLTIDDVVKGQGTIKLGNTAIVTGSQQKPSSSPRLVWQQNGPVTTKTYLSPLHQKQQQQLPLYDSNVSTLPHQNVLNITQQVVRPPIMEQNGMDTSVQQQATNNNKKRIQPKLPNDTGPKRSRKTKINTSQSTIKSSVTSASTLINKPIASSGLSISSSSSGSVTTTDTSKGNLNSDFANNSWQTPNINDNNASNDIREQIICPDRYYAFELDDVFTSKTDERFNASTPPPPLPSISISASVPGQLLTPVSAGKSSTTSVTNPDDVYEDFFSSHMLPSSSTSQENQVTSSVLTPPDFQNTPALQQQYHSQTFEFNDSDLQSQAHTSQIISNTINQMNTHDDAETLSTQTPKSFRRSNANNKKSLKHSSKPSKQQNRLNSNRKHICTRCGLTGLIDITQHEFPKQKGLVFECVSCGNNSLKSNVSADERRRRLAKVAADHLERVECQFCHTTFHSHNDYLMHLRNDHASNKPM